MQSGGEFPLCGPGEGSVASGRADSQFYRLEKGRDAVPYRDHARRRRSGGVLPRGEGEKRGADVFCGRLFGDRRADLFFLPSMAGADGSDQ